MTTKGGDMMSGERGTGPTSQRGHFDGVGLVPHTGVHRIVRRFLEPTQDVIVVVLILTVIGVMVRTLWSLVMDLLTPELSVREIIAETLFMLVLLEMQRLLIIYIRDHYVSVDVMIEVTIVGTLREVLLLGAVEVDAVTLLALTAFVLVLGLVLRFGDLRAPLRRRHHGASAGPPLPNRRRPLVVREPDAQNPKGEP